MTLYIYDLGHYISLNTPQNQKNEYNIQRLKKYNDVVVTRQFLYVHIEETFDFIIVSHFSEISFSSRFIAFFVCTVPKITPYFQFFSSILSLKGNKKGFSKNIEKVRHGFKDMSFTNTFVK